MWGIFELEDVGKIALAVLVGGLIGGEREFHSKPAGLRTNIFICLGSTLFTLFSIKVAAQHDPTRIAAQIASGVGFLGAGAIFRSGGVVVGLTTAATIWLVAALGIGIGAGHYPATIAATVVSLGVLGLFSVIDRWIERTHDTRLYEIILAHNLEKVAQVQSLFEECALKVARVRRMKRGGQLVCEWRATGNTTQHEALVERLLNDAAVLEVKW